MIVQARHNLRVLASATESGFFGDESFDEQFARPQLDIFDAMTIPEGKTFESTWVAKMTAFERGAVILAGVAVNQGDTGPVKEMARQLATQQANFAESLDRMIMRKPDQRVEQARDFDRSLK